MNMDGLYQMLDRAKFKSLVSYEEISTDAFALVNNSQEKLSDIIKNGTVSRATQDLYFSMRLSQNDGNILLDSMDAFTRTFPCGAIVKYFYIKQTAPKVARIKSRCFGGSFTLYGEWKGRCRP